jgi:hypothetical protein
MKKLYYASAFLPLLLAVSCSSGEDLSGCYSNRNTADNVQMRIDGRDGHYSGELDIAIAEKDRNAGSFKGSVEDGVLLVHYTFQSEGVQSVREMAFKIKGDKLLEGYGPMEERDGGMRFTDPENLTFGKGIVLRKNPCD